MPCQGEYDRHFWLILFTLLALMLSLAGCSAGAASRSPGAASPGRAPDSALSSSPTLATRPVPSLSPTAQPPPSPTAQAAPSPTVQPAPPPSPTLTIAPAEPGFGYPIGWPGRPRGDGFFIRHGYAVENTWYNPGHWHTGEDWYAREGGTAGAEVYAIAAGTVVYVGANYPGRVVIVEHAPDLFSMYGHLDPAVAVAEGEQVTGGQVLGVVLRRGDDVPDHLHVEVRTFLTTAPVNGPAPRYGFRCGPRCPPGPGYWPGDAPDHPSDLGWRNPTHVIAGRMFPAAPAPLGEVAVASGPPSDRAVLWSGPPADGAEPRPVGELALSPGERLRLLEVRAGPEDARETSALAYVLWYRVALADGRSGWVQAAVPSSFEVGGDGRPSSVELILLPAP